MEETMVNKDPASPQSGYRQEVPGDKCVVAHGIQLCYWLTFNQVRDLRGTVRKGEKSSIVVYWNFKEVDELNEDTGEVEHKNIPFLKYYRVFNAYQCDGIVLSDQSGVDKSDSREDAEALVNGYHGSPDIKHGFAKACYNPIEDLVKMPSRTDFMSLEKYYSTLFHELVHSTGHATRLNRETMTTPAAFGSRNYAREELVAEMGAAYLCGISGISQATIEHSAAYIQGWRDTISKDSKLVVLAAAQAQKAVNHIVGKEDTEGHGKEVG